MSRFFKYKTSDQLRADAEAMRLEIELSGDLSPLLEPIEVSGRRVGNRLAIQPMEGCDGTTDGLPGELTMRRYRRFGAGGAKLIWGEACAVDPGARANSRQLVINPVGAAALGKMVEETRAAHREVLGTTDDLLIGLQLTHSGRYSYQRPIIAEHHSVLDARTVIDRSTGRTIGPEDRLISDDELDRLQDQYITAAKLAQAAGFDFIDIKQCHRYLLNELLGARTRPGKYGGSFENRTRFIRELVTRLRSEIPGLIVGTRLNLFDGVPYGKDADGNGVASSVTAAGPSSWGSALNDAERPDLGEPLALIGLLRDLGVRLVNVTLGNPYANPHVLRPFEYPPPDGYETTEHPLIGVARHFRLTAEAQRMYPDVAIVGSGYSWLQAFALEAGAANVGAGRTSFVGIGRGSLSQPDFGLRVLRGEPLDRKRICRTFSYCTALMRSKHNEEGQFVTGCPPFDKEVYGPVWDEAKQPKAGPVA